MLDPFNPRSVAFQVEKLNGNIAELPVLADDGMLEAPRRLIVQLTADISTAVADKLDVQSHPDVRKYPVLPRRSDRGTLFPARPACGAGRHRERFGVIYDIKHVTTYEYGSTVTFNYCALRLLPQDGPGQRVLETRLLIDPAPKEMSERFCFFGNRVTSLMIETAHRELTVVASSVVEVERVPAPRPRVDRRVGIRPRGCLRQPIARQSLARAISASKPLRAAFFRR